MPTATNKVCGTCPYYGECADKVATGAMPPFKAGDGCRRQHVVRATLFNGRHETPVTVLLTVWHESVPDVMDFGALETQADEWIMEHFKGKAGMLVLYVTGLSQALLAVVKACYKNGVHLTCMHYDKSADTYLRQIVF